MSLDQPQLKTMATPLGIAAYRGNLECVRLLIEYGANVHHQTKANMTPLFLAARQRKYDVVKYLTSLEGVVEYMESEVENNAFLYAIQSNDKALVKILLHNNANPGQRNEKGETPIAMAAANESEEILEILVTYNKRNINKQSKATKMSPFMTAILNWKYGIADILLQLDCDFRSTDSKGRNILEIAKNEINMGALHYLQSRGMWDGKTTYILKNPDFTKLAEEPPMKGMVPLRLLKQENLVKVKPFKKKIKIVVKERKYDIYANRKSRKPKFRYPCLSRHLSIKAHQFPVENDESDSSSSSSSSSSSFATPVPKKVKMLKNLEEKGEGKKKPKQELARMSSLTGLPSDEKGKLMKKAKDRKTTEDSVEPVSTKTPETNENQDHSDYSPMSDEDMLFAPLMEESIGSPPVTFDYGATKAKKKHKTEPIAVVPKKSVRKLKHYDSKTGRITYSEAPSQKKEKAHSLDTLPSIFNENEDKRVITPKTQKRQMKKKMNTVEEKQMIRKSAIIKGKSTKILDPKRNVSMGYKTKIPKHLYADEKDYISDEDEVEEKDVVYEPIKVKSKTKKKKKLERHCTNDFKDDHIIDELFQKLNHLGQQTHSNLKNMKRASRFTPFTVTGIIRKDFVSKIHKNEPTE